MQDIVFAYPPLFKEIKAKFPAAGRRGVIFSWGGVIYNPSRITIPPHLLVHEAMHGERQEKWGIEQWWRDYIDSAAFRREEEILAHQVEYRFLVREGGNRQARRGSLKQVAKRLASPLYGGVVSMTEARKVLREAAAF